MDVEFSAYLPILELIMNRGLLAKDGIILVDNGELPQESKRDIPKKVEDLANGQRYSVRQRVCCG